MFDLFRRALIDMDQFVFVLYRLVLSEQYLKKSLKLEIMHKSFEHARIFGIIKPGEIYIFCDNEDRKWQPESLDYIYTIRSEIEIFPALDMEIRNLSTLYRFRRYLGHEKVSEDCHQFKLLCYDEERKSTVFSQYLQRVVSFKEKLKEHADWVR